MKKFSILFLILTTLILNAQEIKNDTLQEGISIDSLKQSI